MEVLSRDSVEPSLFVDSDGDDDDVQIISAPRPVTRRTGNLDFGFRSSTRNSSVSRRTNPTRTTSDRGASRHSMVSRAASARSGSAAATPPVTIDLTDEPDSPVLSQRAVLNPRPSVPRQRSTSAREENSVFNMGHRHHHRHETAAGNSQGTQTGESQGSTTTRNLRRMRPTRISPLPPIRNADFAALTESQGSTRNPRRTNSQGVTPPSLNRSDNTSLMSTGSYNVIDLTADSPEEQPRTRRLPLPRPQHDEPHHHRHHALLQHQSARHIDLFSQIQTMIGSARQHGGTVSARFGPSALMGRLLGGQVPMMLDVTQNAYAVHQQQREQGSPKPPMEEIPAARAGFTRATKAAPEDAAGTGAAAEGETTVVVCPACEEELAYDPTVAAGDEKDGSGGAVARSGRKRKRAPGDHHFWALKACGHVYCADCFENRKPPAKNRGVGPFPNRDGAYRCAVDGCETKVVAKGEWVGIFL